MGQWELESRLEQLLDVWPPDILLLLNLGNSQDLHIPKSRTVSCSHVLVHRLDGLSSGKGSELLHHLSISIRLYHPCQVLQPITHVVGAGSGVVSEPDGEVLDLQWLLLVDLPVNHDPYST